MAKASKADKSEKADNGDDATSARVRELEEALAREKQDRDDAEDRAKRANDRARDGDEAYRKLQLEVVAAKDEVSALRDEKIALQDKAKALEEGLTKLHQEIAELKAAAVKAADQPSEPTSAAAPPSAPSEQEIHVQELLVRIQGLREMLSETSSNLSQLHADEVALSKKRARILADACAILARAVGATGQAPPPLPSAMLEARLSIAPVVDISEVAEIIESLRPPKPVEG